MSTIKINIAIFVVFLGVAAGFILVTEWQVGTRKSESQILPLIHHDSVRIKPKQAQHFTAPIISKKEKQLQQKLNKALANISRLQREKLVLIDKLNSYSTTNSSVNVEEDILAEKEIVPYLQERIQTTEQLEDRFNQENQDLDWAISVETAITNQYYDSPVNGNKLLDARCQLTLCRVEMTHADREAEALFWANASGVEGLSAEQIHIQRIESLEEGLKTIIFISRQGHTIYPNEKL
jgi:hypothetical protein